MRRGVALSWSALFILSLLLQYMSFAMAPSALAVHDEGKFELDGNATSEAAPGEDWDHVFAGTDAAESTVFVTDKVNTTADDIFTGGSSKDINDTSDWLWTTSKPQAKNDITHAFAAAYTATNADTAGDTLVYFGLNKYDASGDNFVGFWFLKGAVGPTGSGVPSGSPFSGSHSVGDVLVLADYTNGGGVSTFSVYQWVTSGGDVSTHLNTVASGVPCTNAGVTDLACAATNLDTTDSPWPFTDKSGENDFLAGELFEGGINLTDLGLDSGCFTSFIAETRSSQSVTATLSDFAGGQFSFCVPPTISTQVRQDGQSLGSVGSISMGESVTDHATFSGSKGAVEGSADFFVCFNASSTPNCASGGTAVGSSDIDSGAADSDEFTPDAVGYYCFRVDFTPVAASKYLAASHTNQTTECFQVLPANVTIDKTADDGSVSAGEPIGFTVSWGNSGAGKATGVVVSDPLPAGDDLDWSIAGSTGSGSTCSIAGAVGSQALTCNVGTIAGNTAVSGTVHIVSDTTAADCGTVDNTGSIDSGNDGSGEASDSVDVLCPDVLVQKSAAADQIRVGDTASFTITVSNIGKGVAKDVVLTDPLPGGLTWTIDPAVQGCSITSGTLTCNLGDLDPTDSVSITVTADTDGLTGEGGGCVNLPNTASAEADNEGSNVLANNQASADIDVCNSVLTIAKSVLDVNDAAPVNDPDLGVPGAEIGDVVTFSLHYTGGGLLENAFIVDVLPVGEDYVAGSASSNADFGFTSATLDSGTQQWTLRWDATGTLPDPADGAVTYDVTVLEAAAEQPQPLTNTATIDSDQTPPDSDTAAIAVAPPPEALTPPPTDVFTTTVGTSNPGFALMLILLGVAAATLGIGFITPVPARTRRRDR
ncbi:MAG TPA: DUF11 domain-containing protein [Candidatus Limnocylindrales bacterium]|nr:DUF11 domain-containing protein [Candidatus Limnocylindrales bacterium]